MNKNETKILNNDEEKFQIPSEEEIKRKELISILAELILNYSVTKNQ
ncbi:hypothetical protein [Brevibacillus sp. AY1]|nr:hypothetical protein [Brevibacillus sp. AY1]MDH4619303.1 hypothetical protein [Brevibacillus sp. AY1]